MAVHNAQANVLLSRLHCWLPGMEAGIGEARRPGGGAGAGCFAEGDFGGACVGNPHGGEGAFDSATRSEPLRAAPENKRSFTLWH
jgi:hypothetical protein